MSGCGTTTEDLRLHDRGVFLPSIKIAHELTDSSQSGQNNRKSRVAAELEMGHVSGTTSQGIDASQFINFGGGTFQGPDEIEGNYGLFTASLALRLRLNDPADIFGIAFLGGLGGQNFSLELDDGNISSSNRIGSVGPLIGLQFSLEPYPSMDVYVRGTQVVGFGDATTSLGLVEIEMSIRPYSHLAFEGGYRIMKYRKIGSVAERIGPGEAKINLVLSGPTVGLRLDF